MSDTATKSLNHILKSGDYSVIENVPIFDEHDEFDSEGKPVRKFDRAALQKIVDTCNKRSKSGDLSPFGPGHTISDAPEHLQPVTYGYASDFRVDHYGPEKKLGILCKFHVKNQVTRPDGKQADGLEEVKSYPRRSIELWLKDAMIDHIALLRRTPQRDLGLLDYSKKTTHTIPSTNILFSSQRRDRSLTAAVRGGKLCYAMEQPMNPAMKDDDQMGGDDFDPNGEDHKKFSRHADHYMKTKYGDKLKQYEMGSAPSGGNTFVPGDGDEDDKLSPDMSDPTKQPIADDEDDVQKMAKSYAKAAPAVQAAQFARLVQRLRAVEGTAKSQQAQFSKDDAEQRVAGLVAEGYMIDDPADEVNEMKRLPLGAERDKKVAKIRKNYQRDMFQAVASGPIRGGMLDTGRDAPSGKRSFSRQENDRVVAYIDGERSRGNEISYEDARAKLFPER
jgi:hypothetical protein